MNFCFVCWYTDDGYCCFVCWNNDGGIAVSRVGIMIVVIYVSCAEVTIMVIAASYAGIRIGRIHV